MSPIARASCQEALQASTSINPIRMTPEKLGTLVFLMTSIGSPTPVKPHHSQPFSGRKARVVTPSEANPSSARQGDCATGELHPFREMHHAFSCVFTALAEVAGACLESSGCPHGDL